VIMTSFWFRAASDSTGLSRSRREFPDKRPEYSDESSDSDN
jgi:hypothetical protein